MTEVDPEVYEDVRTRLFDKGEQIDLLTATPEEHAAVNAILAEQINLDLSAAPPPPTPDPDPELPVPEPIPVASDSSSDVD